MAERVAPTAPSFSLGRIGAVMIRQAFLYKRALYRWLELVYWPVVDLVLWGYITIFLARSESGLARPAAFFLGALILWDILFRAQQAVTTGFLEDVWGRNVLNMWASPIRPSEYVLGTILFGVIRVTVGVGVVILLAVALYDFNFLSIGIALVPFILALVMMGWAVGIVTTAIILRYGEGAEVLAWALPFLFQPFSAVFYPVDVLPGAMRTIAAAIPASYVFEGMRQVIGGGRFPTGDLLWATLIDGVYLVAAWAFFAWMLRQVKARGLLARFGE